MNTQSPAVNPVGAATSTRSAAAVPTGMAASTQSPPADPTEVATPGCADLQKVMGYLKDMSFSNFQEGEPVNGLSVKTFSDQDALNYGQSMTILYTGSCVLDISGVFASHYPPTDAEKPKFSLFMTAISLAGLTTDQRQALVDWVASKITSGILHEAEKNGTAKRSTTLSWPAAFPAVELKDEVTEDTIFTHYHAVFGTLPAK